MTETISFTIEPDLLGGIGSLFPNALSPISPLNYGGCRTLLPDEVSSLVEAGVLEDSKTIAGNIHSTLDALADSNAYARVQLIAWDELIEHVHYFSPHNGSAVSLTTRSEGVLIQDPAPMEQILEILRQNVGASFISGCGLEAELSVEGALVLAALIDMHRKRILAAFITGRKFKPLKYRPADVLAELQRSIDSPDWLVATVRDISHWQAELEETDIANTMNNLVAAGHLKRVGEHFVLGEGALSVGKHLLVVDNIITLESCKLVDDQQIVSTGFICLQSGLHNLLLIEHNTGMIRFTSISPAALLILLEHFLRGSDILKDLSEAITTTLTTTCPQCGAEMARGQQFCEICGASLLVVEKEPQARIFCTNCGKPIDADSKFCSECGARVE